MVASPSLMSMLSGRDSDLRDHVLPRVLRGRISDVNRITGGKGSQTEQPTMTFDVIVEGGAPTGDAEGLLKGVPMLQAGFGSLAAPTQAPGGIVYIPEVGSVVLVMFDGRGWVIIGFYTGPVQTARETGGDPERLRISYNTGVELPVSRQNLQPGLDNTPHWAFIAEAGDAILCKGDARVKVNAIGAIIGANATCWDIYKSDGMKMERSLMRETRMGGYHHRHFFYPGLPPAALEAAQPATLAAPNPGAYIYQAEILDTGPDPKMLKPYYLRQRGHVGGFDRYTGHRGGMSINGTQSVASETANKTFSVSREAVVQPLSPVDSSTPPTELLPFRATSAEVYDHQILADGSFTLRAGNRTLRPGGQVPAIPTSQLDLSIEYSAKSGSYSIRLGTAGAPAALVTITARTPADAKVTVIAKDLEATLTGSARVIAPDGVTIVGNVKVIGALTVAGPADIKGLLTCPDMKSAVVQSFNAHTHQYLLPIVPIGFGPTATPL